MGGGKKGGQKRRVVDYFMSMHYGICSGPVDELLAIKIKDLVAWEGNVTANSSLVINKPELFGGDEKEGGVIGLCDVLFGSPAQVLSDYLSSKFGRTSATMPGYRGVMSLFFYGFDGGPVPAADGADSTSSPGIFAPILGYIDSFLGLFTPGTPATAKGFMWCQNNPYLPPVAATVRRRPRGLSSATAMIVRDEITDANPAHIIYECYTNTDWSLGWPSDRFNVGVWEDVAQTLYDEGFGMSLQWVNSIEVEKFVGEIQDHILAVIYEDPTNGLLNIKLIRDDYDIDTAFEVNVSNATLTKAERRSIEDTVNEIIVSWTNPLSEKEETVAAQDLGNIAAQGRIVSETRNYYGVRTQSLAMELAARDLRSASYPLFSCEAALDRTARTIVPGEVVRLVWPERGIEAMACRVMDVDYGKSGDGKIILTLVEDIFGLEEGSFTAPSGTLWTDVPDEALPFTISDFLTLPYPLLSRAGETGIAYPGVLVGVLARERQAAMSSFTVSTEVVLPDSSVEVRNYTRRLSTPAAAITAELPLEAVSTLTDAELGAFSESYTAAVGDILYLAGTGDDVSEIVMLSAYSTGTWTIERGLYDTVPKVWPIGSVAWVLSEASAYDPNIRTPGADVSYWLRPVTLAGTLPLEDATEEVFTPSERPHLPFRPTDVRVEGVAGFGTYTYGVLPADISITWKNRNRTMEDTVALLWGDPTTTGETDQTTTVRVRDTYGNFIIEYTGITGTSYDIPIADVVTETVIASIEVIAVRDGLESLQYQARVVELPAEGYGIGYGVYYG